ncbi:MAG TPA: hypothetical protein VMD59_14380, partial [Acidimicrobiales bacterium]|nr:hypothetical protein [Acidimicrobiales bacterium]
MGSAGSWLLCDYGEVLCLAPTDEDRAEMATLAGPDADGFWERYWLHRPAYDRGDLTTPQYWEAVLGEVPGPAALEGLRTADLR